MTAHQVIEEMYLSPELDSCIQKFVRTDHQQDFKQELFLIIYTLPHPQILDLHTTGTLKFYIVRIIINLWRQKRNVYHKKYLDRATTYDTDHVTNLDHPEDIDEEREEREKRELDLLGKVERLDELMKSPYYLPLVKLVAEHGSQREVARLTGIEYSSICKALKRVRERLLQVD